MARKIQPPPLREGRYNKSMSPEEFKARNPGTRPSVTMLILHSDYKLLWKLGKGRLTYGLQVALSRLRELDNDE